MVNNMKIRTAIMEAGLRHWQVAKAAGISEFTLSVWLRQELNGERLERIESAIARLSAEQGGVTK